MSNAIYCIPMQYKIMQFARRMAESRIWYRPGLTFQQ
jgi:hypothetical protein